MVHESSQIPQVTVHGRFQPPLHINHWNYIAHAFRIADKVTILITNPYLEEAHVQESPYRNKLENNPFTYEQRVAIFTSFFDAMGIAAARYEFKPFDITNEKSWHHTLDTDVPNLVNTYGAWSNAKLQKFNTLGYKVIHTTIPKIMNSSGTVIREILNKDVSPQEKKALLVQAGYMSEAIEGLFRVLGLPYELTAYIDKAN